MRALVLRFDSLGQLVSLLEASGDEQDLQLPDADERFRDGEWVLTNACVGDRVTSVAACVLDRGDGQRLAFEARDWERLWNFAQGDLPPTSTRPPAPEDRISYIEPVAPGTTILLVDDDTALQRVVGQLFFHAGYKVVTKGSAEDALQELTHHKYDLLVVDWNLPGMNGVELCRLVRARGNSVPLLFLTAHSSSEDIVLAFEAGADDFVSKPFRVPELMARVMGLMRRSSVAPTAGAPAT